MFHVKRWRILFGVKKTNSDRQMDRVVFIMMCAIGSWLLAIWNLFFGDDEAIFNFFAGILMFGISYYLFEKWMKVEQADLKQCIEQHQIEIAVNYFEVMWLRGELKKGWWKV